MTRFRYVKVCNNLVTDEIDDHRIQSDYKCTIGLQHLGGKNSTLGVAHAWWTRQRNQWQRDHQDPRAPSTQRTWTSTREMMHAWSHVHVVQQSGSGRHDLHTTSWLKLWASLMSSMHAVSVTLRLWALHSIQLPLLLILFQSPAFPPVLLPQPCG